MSQFISCEFINSTRVASDVWQTGLRFYMHRVVTWHSLPSSALTFQVSAHVENDDLKWITGTQATWQGME